MQVQVPPRLLAELLAISFPIDDPVLRRLYFGSVEATALKDYEIEFIDERTFKIAGEENKFVKLGLIVQGWAYSEGKVKWNYLHGKQHHHIAIKINRICCFHLKVCRVILTQLLQHSMARTLSRKYYPDWLL